MMGASTAALLRDRLLRHVADRPSSAAEACGRLGISQSRFSRLVARMPADLLRFGRARATRYVARRRWPGLGASPPL